MASSKTRVVSIRLPLDVVEKIEKNASKLGKAPGEYIRRILILQVMRKR